MAFGSSVVRILVVEDDPKVARFLQRGLEAERHVVEIARTRAHALRRAASGAFDLLILDLELFGRDGYGVIQHLRRDGTSTGVIVLASNGASEDRIRALDGGADDCLLKPFSFAELAARIRALQRRLVHSFEPTLRAGDLILDLVRHRVTVAGRPVELTPREYQLLDYFVRHQGEILSRAVLADRVWGVDFDTGTNVIDVYVNYLRRKLAASGCHCTIQTVRGVGYALMPGAPPPEKGGDDGPTA